MSIAQDTVYRLPNPERVYQYELCGIQIIVWYIDHTAQGGLASPQEHATDEQGSLSKMESRQQESRPSSGNKLQRYSKSCCSLAQKRKTTDGKGGIGVQNTPVHMVRKEEI